MKFCVIGVGRLGYHVATTLADHGMDVLAIDSNEAIIASIKDKVTQAICLRINDEESLRSVGIEYIDTVIVAMGENFAQSILVTALLKQNLKIPTVIARSISEIHKDILTLIGADQVLLPEKEMGIRLADSLSLPFSTLRRITPQFSISQIKAPKKFAGKTIKEISLQKNYHVMCIGQKIDDEIKEITQDYIFNEKDILLFSGNNAALEKISKL
ncbi:MAG: TrkA family potassium uptake protein [Candidatus Babeliaceae bacterium]|jgi:trk system potassium uptake protein TrkA